MFYFFSYIFFSYSNTPFLLVLLELNDWLFLGGTHPFCYLCVWYAEIFCYFLPNQQYVGFRSSTQ